MSTTTIRLLIALGLVARVGARPAQSRLRQGAGGMTNRVMELAGNDVLKPVGLTG